MFRDILVRTMDRTSPLQRQRLMGSCSSIGSVVCIVDNMQQVFVYIYLYTPSCTTHKIVSLVRYRHSLQLRRPQRHFHPCRRNHNVESMCCNSRPNIQLICIICIDNLPLAVASVQLLFVVVHLLSTK
jgi:hypothetical protein